MSDDTTDTRLYDAQIDSEAFGRVSPFAFPGRSITLRGLRELTLGGRTEQEYYHAKAWSAEAFQASIRGYAYEILPGWR